MHKFIHYVKFSCFFFLQQYLIKLKFTLLTYRDFDKLLYHVIINYGQELFKSNLFKQVRIMVNYQFLFLNQMVLFDIRFSVMVLKYNLLHIFKFSDLNLRKLDWDTKTQVLMLRLNLRSLGLLIFISRIKILIKLVMKKN